MLTFSLQEKTAQLVRMRVPLAMVPAWTEIVRFKRAEVVAARRDWISYGLEGMGFPF